MTKEKSISWVFLSIAIASKIEPADFREISMIADGINHAVPTHKELQTSISWLIEKDLVLKHSNKYELSKKGAEEFEKISVNKMGYLKMMESLELILKSL